MKKFKPVAFRGTAAQLRYRMCERKVAHEQPVKKKGKRCYRCPHCGKYHLTTLPRRLSQK